MSAWTATGDWRGTGIDPADREAVLRHHADTDSRDLLRFADPRDKAARVLHAIRRPSISWSACEQAANALSAAQLLARPPAPVTHPSAREVLLELLDLHYGKASIPTQVLANMVEYLDDLDAES